MLEKNVAFNVEGIVNEDTSDIIKNTVEQLMGFLKYQYILKLNA